MEDWGTAHPEGGHAKTRPCSGCEPTGSSLLEVWLELGYRVQKKRKRREKEEKKEKKKEKKKKSSPVLSSGGNSLAEISAIDESEGTYCQAPIGRPSS